MAAVALMCGCSLFEEDIFTGTRRNTHQQDNNSSGRDSLRDVSGSGSTVSSRSDTIFYCAAVRYPENYHWQKDTACNNAPCELLLYKDGKLIMSTPAGPGSNVSPAPDLHHLIGGKLYTEYAYGGETVVCCNGEELLRFEEEEILYGLVSYNNHIYTLSRDRKGNGINYRKDGVIEFVKGTGRLFGGFGHSSYPETGGLYLDGKDVVFCYQSSSVDATCHVVINGQDREITSFQGKNVQDLKYVDREAEFTTKTSFGMMWADARVVLDSQFRIAGYSAGWTVAAQAGSSTKRLCMGEAAFYCYGSLAASVDCTGKEDVTVCYSTGRKDEFKGRWYFLSPACGCLVGENLLLGLSPKERNAEAKLYCGKREIVLENPGNGYITAVAGEINPPR